MEKIHPKAEALGFLFLKICKSWSKVGNDQTGKQFKEEVVEQLRKLIKPESELWKGLGTHKKAWNS